MVDALVSSEKSEYIDYELFLSEDFSPAKFANTLVQATNTPTDSTIDLKTPKKKVVYDLYEVNSLIKTKTSQNSTTLLKSLTSTSQAESSVGELKQTLEHVNNSYDKLVKDFLVPYNESQKIFQSLKSLNNTTSLLRSATWYLQLSAHLAAQSAAASLNKEPQACIRSIIAMKQIIAYEAANPALRGLEVIRLHQSNALPAIERSLVEWCTKTINALSPMSNQSDRLAVIIAIKALYLLNANQMVKTIKSFVIGKVKESQALFKRNMVSLASIENNLYESSKRGKSVMILTEVLAAANVPLLPTNYTEASGLTAGGLQEDDSTALLDVVYKQSSNGEASLISTYYKNFSLVLSNYLKDNIVNNYTPASRSIINNIDSLETTVKDCVLKSGNGYLTESSMEMKIMVGAIRILHKA